LEDNILDEKRWEIFFKHDYIRMGVFVGDTKNEAYLRMVNELTIDVLFGVSDDPSIDKFLFFELSTWDDDLDFCDPT
jgi:hypothetical protein